MGETDFRAGFLAAADFFQSVVDRVPADRWAAPGLGEWTIRDLTGHASRALSTVEAYLPEPVAGTVGDSPIDYYVLVRPTPDGHAQIAQRGREAGAALGADPAAAVRALVERAGSVLAGVEGDRPIRTPVGGLRLRDYLPTRTFELTVHGLDLAAALGLAVDPPAAAADECLAIAADLARRRGLAGPLLLALTGRGPLPAGFTVL